MRKGRKNKYNTSWWDVKYEFKQGAIIKLRISECFAASIWGVEWVMGSLKIPKGGLSLVFGFTFYSMQFEGSMNC